MENAFTKSTSEVLKFFKVSESHGLTAAQVKASREKHGRNGKCLSPAPSDSCANSLTAIPDEPPTPIWKLILEQFKDQLVLILLGSAAVSFVLAIFEDEGGWGAFVDPAVVCPVPGSPVCPKCSLKLDCRPFARF